MSNPLPGVGDQMDRKRQGGRGRRKRFPVCFRLPPGLLLVRAKPQKPIQVGPPPPLTLTRKQVRSDGVKQRDGEITGEDDKHREKVRKEKSEEDCVCASA